MKTLKRVPYTVEYVETMPNGKEMVQGVVYISEKYKCTIHLCLCGCGNQTVLPIGYMGWVMTKEKDSVSFTPSVGNFNFPCKSHYIMTNGVANFV